MTTIPLPQGRPLRHCRPLLPARYQDRVHQQCGLRGPLRRVTCSDLEDLIRQQTTDTTLLFDGKRTVTDETNILWNRFVAFILKY